MKKIFIIISALFISVTIYAQDTAKIGAIVVSNEGKVLAGEQIIFEATDGSYKIKNVSDVAGKFKTLLIAGKTYNIKVKTVGKAEKATTIAIPALEKGQSNYLGELTLTITETKSFTLNNVYFDSNKSTLKQSSYKELKELLEYLTLKKDIKIEISGHTDDVGNDNANMKLSEDRAKSVKTFLTKDGISSERIVVKAYGETQPVASNETEEGRKQNRRIEIKVL